MFVPSSGTFFFEWWGKIQPKVVGLCSNRGAGAWPKEAGAGIDLHASWWGMVVETWCRRGVPSHEGWEPGKYMEREK